jgi:hypothetical protein
MSRLPTSLYRIQFGRNPLAKTLMTMLELGEVGRFRDCYLYQEKDGDEPRIHLLTRNGGGNRAEYRATNEALGKHPDYEKDFDDEVDSTYATFVFRFPARHRTAIEHLFATRPDAIMRAPFGRLAEKFVRFMQSHPDDPHVKAIAELMRPMFEHMAKSKGGVFAIIDGEVDWRDEP